MSVDTPSACFEFKSMDGRSASSARQGKASSDPSGRLPRILAALSATNEAILRSKTVEEMLQKVATAAVDGGGFLGSAIYRKESSGTAFVMDASAGAFTESMKGVEINADPNDPHGQGIAGIVFRSNKSCFVDDVLSDRRIRFWWGLAKTARVKSCAVLPISVNGKPVGVMYFFLGQDYGRLDSESANLIDRMAENVSFGLAMFEREVTRRRAHRKQKQLGRMYAALSATNEAIMRARTREEMFELVCAAAVLGGEFTSTTIAIADGDQEFLRIAAAQGPNAEQVRLTRVSVSEARPEGHGLTGTAFRTKQACIINDLLHDRRASSWHTLVSEGGTRSGAGYPLLVDGVSVGVLLFLSPLTNVFTPDLADLLERMAENVSFALQNFEREEKRQTSDRQIRYLAAHDTLTGLFNRNMFSKLLEDALTSACREDRKSAVLFIDLDRFKIINDTLGHSAGDELLVEIGRRIAECLEEQDLLARFGGDEFVAFLGDLTRTPPAAVASRLLAAISRPLLIGGHELRTTASVGIAIHPCDGDDQTALLKSADKAMYAAKENGKSQFRFYSAGRKTPAVHSLKLETSLHHALERNQFEIYYQAKVDRQTETVTGVEALLRWMHPELGIVSPANFIPLAEETGLIVPIGRWVMNTACAQNVAWQDQGLPTISMAVNLSPRQFLDADLLNDVDEILRSTGMDPTLLHLEITESMVMQNVERATDLLEAIRARGVRLAIDDFGTGYSSISQMKRFPVDTIKIDRSFVKDLAESAEDRAITIAIIAMAKALGLKIVAEGVETYEQNQFLRDQLCDEMQGYLFSKPLPAAQVPNLLLASHASPKLQPDVVSFCVSSISDDTLTSTTKH